ncbi:type I secretion protein [Ruegeria sp.]|uniref:type I secretion protein n=1 Tax=Ruegeria sp. TaxID=1879320 RepID=UPI003B5CBE05
MALDSITEQIAHFVGAFELTTEQARLRDQYEEFVALRRKAELEDLEDPTSVQISANLALESSDHDALSYNFAAAQASAPAIPSPTGPAGGSNVSSGPAADSDVPAPDIFMGGPTTIEMVFELEFDTELAGSAVTYTFQTIRLSDNDTIGEGDFRDVEALMEQGQEMLDIAMSLHAVSFPSLNIDDYLSGEAVDELIEQIQSGEWAEIEGAVVYQFEGDAATGVIVNGEYVEEAPEFTDLLPEHHQPEDEDVDEDEAPDLLPAEWDQSDNLEFEDGHSIVAGGNLAVNQVAVNVGWVDAPNIVVGGKALSVTVVSQVAVVSDTDQGEEGVQSNTNVVQSSEITVDASEAAWLDENVSEDPEDTPFVAVDWISGDLLVTNFIEQTIDATDIDQISTEITASSTSYILGDNVMVNSTELLQLGSFYDLIIIGGDMISIDVVSQTIVLSDNDVIEGAQPTEAEENLVMNEVTLTTTGEDTYEDVSESLAGVIPLEEMDSDALEDALMNDPMFAGTELVRVLKIEGDLLQINAIEQVTILQDDDDILIAGEQGAEASALGAGNAILNSASVNKIGVDSVVMAQGGEYSDLLLHQASLIDAPEDENPELGNDAVAILLQEVDAPGNSENAPGHSDLTSSEAAGIDGGMETMLV